MSNPLFVESIVVELCATDTIVELCVVDTVVSVPK
jgi:hypothetical protein